MPISNTHRRAGILLPLTLTAMLLAFAATSQADERVRLVPASQLGGLTVRTADGQLAGRTEHVMIDASSARVRYVVLAAAGKLKLDEDERVALPFSHLDFRGSGDEEIQATVTLKQLRAAERVQESALAELANPIMSAKLYDHYLTPEAERVETTGRPAAQGDPADTEVPVAPAEQAEDKRYPQVMVTRDVVSTVVPGQDSTGGIFGADVTSSLDEDFGEIDELMVDVERGLVAYALIDHGGYLGIGEQWYAVPLQQLTWTTLDEAYLVSAPEKPFASIPKTELPTSVSSRELSEFYAAFPLTETPYGKQEAADKPDTGQ